MFASHLFYEIHKCQLIREIKRRVNINGSQILSILIETVNNNIDQNFNIITVLQYFTSLVVKFAF